MSNECIYQARLENEGNCLIPIKLQKCTLKITGWECEFFGKEDKCPVVMEYQKKALEYHDVLCDECEYNCDEYMEDSIRQCGEDAHN